MNNDKDFCDKIISVIHNFYVMGETLEEIGNRFAPLRGIAEAGNVSRKDGSRLCDSEALLKEIEGIAEAVEAIKSYLDRIIRQGRELEEEILLKKPGLLKHL